MNYYLVRGLVFRYRTSAGALALTLLLLGASTARAALTWDTAGPSNNWSTAAGNENWDPGNVVWNPGDDAIFNAVTGETVQATIANTSVDDIDFQAGTWTIGNGGGSLATVTGDNSAISVATGLTITFSEQLGGAGGVTKLGPGTLNFTTAGGQTWTGTTSVDQGSMTMTAANPSTYAGGAISIGTASTSGTLNLAGTRYDFNAETFTFGSFGGSTLATGAVNFVQQLGTGAGNFYVTTGGAQNTISGSAFNLHTGAGGGVTFDVATGTDTTADLLVSALILNTRGITKIGAGRMALTGINTYSGGTAIDAGTLLANTAGGTNSATGTGVVTVGVSGTLGGTGQIRPGSSNAIAVNGTLAPGENIGTLTINSAGSAAASILTMASGSFFEFELGAAGVTLAAFGTSDRLAINTSAVGDVTFNSNTIDFQGTGANGFYKLFDTSLANATLGGDTWANLTYDTTTGIVSAGLSIANLAGTGTLIVGTASNGGDLGDIYLSVVPEPGSFGMLLFGSAVLWLVRSKRSF